MGETLLAIKDLSVALGWQGERQTILNGINLQMGEGEKLGVVGESGSGKSVTALSILKLLDTAQVQYGGRVEFAGRSLLDMPEEMIRSVRGRDIAMVFQEPMTALNPVQTIGQQLMEPLFLHEKLKPAQAKTRMLELLQRVGIKEPDKRFDSYVHQLSGGQRQRVMIAMALACHPKLLIADEPTTALDVTIQAQILALLDELQSEFNMAVMLISHDLNLVRHFADRVAVMQAGQVVESGAVSELFAQPQHPYTIKLIHSEPEVLVDTRQKEAIAQAPVLLQGDTLKVYFPIKQGFWQRTVDYVRAVDHVSLELRQGETLGIVGESGSGKTTLGMSLLRMQESEGRIRFQGQDIEALSQREMRPLRAAMQIVFQDPFSSLSPRLSVFDIISEGLELHFPELDAAQRKQAVADVLQEVGLEAGMMWRYPHEFSGGQRQRIAIARAVALRPKLILLDEPTSALDVSVQKQVLALLHDLQQKYGLSYLFITHDLRVIRAMSHRLIVMHQGKVVESGDTETVFKQPQDPYTQRLLQATLFRPGHG